MNHDINEVKRAANGKWPVILKSLAGLTESQLSNRHQPCPSCGGTDRYRYDDKTGDGDYYCNQCDPGDGISLLMKVTGWDFDTAVNQAGDYLGLSCEDQTSRASKQYREMLDARQAERSAMETDRQRKEEEKHAQAAKIALEIWKSASQITDENPYLYRKGIKSVDTLREIDTETACKIAGYAIKSGGELLTGKLLVVPMRAQTSAMNPLSSVEFIDETGRKAALAGGKKKGSYWASESQPQGDGAGLTIAIGEGVATVLSAIQAFQCIGIAAFSCNNLGTVTQSFRLRFPNSRIIVLADLGNGQSDAERAAQENGCSLVIPRFTPDQINQYKMQHGKEPSDCNDLHKLGGLEAVRGAIEFALRRPPQADDRAPERYLWPEPLPFPSTLLPVEPFDFDLLPDSLGPWIKDIADRMQCPPDFPAVGAMVALSSVIGRKACIKPKRQDDWTVTPNLWGIVVGRPGVMKSPALTEALKPLDRLSLKANELHQEALKNYELEKRLREMTKKGLEGKAQKAATKGNESEAKRLLMEASEAEEAPPPALRRYKVTDASVEALGEILMENPWGTLAYRDEINGLLRGLDKEGQEGARAFYLQGYDGNQSYTFDRIMRGRNLHIPAVCISLLGGIQPGKLQTYIRDAISGGAGDDGLLQRFGLLVWPNVAGDWKNVDRWPDTEAKNRAFRTFERLDAMLPEIDNGTGEQAPKAYRFSTDAQHEFECWRSDIEIELRDCRHHPALESHFSKYRKLIPALALVISLADDEPEVSHRSLVKALAWSEYLRSHAERAYGAGTLPDTDGAKALLARIKEGKLNDGFKPSDVYLKGWAHLSSPERVHLATSMLCDLNHLRRIDHKSGSAGGRPSTTFMINPANLGAA